MNGNIKKIRQDILTGTPIVIVDDYDRENEGDLMIAAEKSDIGNVSFIMREAGGLMCLPCIGIRLDELNIPMMVSNSTDRLKTAFTVSVDAMNGVTTGMSVHDRVRTINVLLSPESIPSDLSRPGHLFPLRAVDGLLKQRRGHTEASVELCRLFGLREIAVIAEIINDDGTMARGDSLIKFANTNNLNIISVEEIYDAIYHKGV